MFFDWDDSKEKLNIAKHGIGFSIAAKVFNDPYRIEDYDEIHSISEDRYITIGRIQNSLILIVTVVYTARNDTIRIISARLATKKEEEAYFSHEENY